jgi:hypothetical protein
VRVGCALCSQAERFGVVAGPQQAKHALCARAELNFGPESILSLKNSLFIFHLVLN